MDSERAQISEGSSGAVDTSVETSADSEETPLPRRKVAVLMCISLSESLSVNMLYPIIPFLVRRFPEVNQDDSSEVAYYASLIGSTFNMAQFVSSFWCLTPSARSCCSGLFPI